MAKKLQRVFRQSPLSAEDANRDATVRKNIEGEFPPAAEVPPQTLATSFSGSLRQAIAGSEKSVEAIATEVGLSSDLIERFVRGERDIRVATAERLAAALGLRVVAMP